MRCMYKLVPTKAVLYDRCNKWFHLRCTTVDLKTYIDPSSSNEKWFCDNCGWSINFTDSFFESSTEQNVSSLTSVVSVDSSPRFCNSLTECLLLNARSLPNKVNDLTALLLMDSSGIVSLTET